MSKAKINEGRGRVRLAVRVLPALALRINDLATERGISLGLVLEELVREQDGFEQKIKQLAKAL